MSDPCTCAAHGLDAAGGAHRPTDPQGMGASHSYRRLPPVMNVSSTREERLVELRREVERAEHMSQALLSLANSIAQSPPPVDSYAGVWQKVARRLSQDARRVNAEADPLRIRIEDITNQINNGRNQR